jgi:hypothetical protein
VGCERRSVLADDDRRDSLPHDGFGARVVPEGAVAVRVNVDETRRDEESAYVELEAPRVAQTPPDGDDASVADPDIGVDTGSPASVDDVTAAQHDIVARATGEEERRVREDGRRTGGANEIPSRGHGWKLAISYQLSAIGTLGGPAFGRALLHLVGPIAGPRPFTR